MQAQPQAQGTVHDLGKLYNEAKAAGRYWKVTRTVNKAGQERYTLKHGVTSQGKPEGVSLISADRLINSKPTTTVAAGVRDANDQYIFVPQLRLAGWLAM